MKRLLLLTALISAMACVAWISGNWQSTGETAIPMKEGGVTSPELATRMPVGDKDGPSAL